MSSINNLKRREIPRVPEAYLKSIFPWLGPVLNSTELTANDNPVAMPIEQGAPESAMPFWRKGFLALASVALLLNPTRASHLAGVNITHQCISGSTYRIVVTVLRDCEDADAQLGDAYNISYENGCATDQTLQVQLQNGYPVEISQLCAAELPNSTCNGGQQPGMQRWVYSAMITLSPACGPYTFWWEPCCRNTMVNFNNTSNAFHAEATLDPSLGCNDGPSMPNLANQYVCLGQPIDYTLNISDPDGDSLVFALIPATGLDGVVGNYAPLSYSQPIQQFTFNTQSGAMHALPETTGNYLVTVQVTEYNDNGEVLGISMYEIQFIVMDCTGSVPTLPTVPDVVLGNIGAPVPNEFVLCGQGAFAFDLSFADQDVDDELTLTCDIASALPGASFYQSGSNPAVAHFNWTWFPGAPAEITVTVHISDNSCPIALQSEMTFILRTAPSPLVTTGGDQSICPQDTALISALGAGGTEPYSYQWSNGLPGTASVPVSPASNTSYTVQVLDALGCLSAPTLISVIILPLPDVSFTVDQLNVCPGQAHEFINTTPASMLGGNCVWTFSDGQSSSSCSGASVIFPAVGCYDATLLVTSADGCVEHMTLIDAACVQAFPVAAFISTPVDPDMDQPRITFHNASSDATGEFWSNWEFGLAGILGYSTELDPSLYLPSQDSGTYFVTLVVSNMFGCVDSVSHPVYMQGLTDVYVPDGFTPNGDGVNDVWSPVGRGVRKNTFELCVFDRGGQPIFTTQDLEVGWNGRYGNSAAEVPNGVYVWRMNFSSKYSVDSRSLMGSITLLR